MPEDFRTVEARSFVISNFRLQNGAAPGVMRDLAAGGVDARYFDIDSELGHSASGPEHAKWSPVLRQFLEPLMSERR